MIRGYNPHPEWGRAEKLSKMERNIKLNYAVIVVVGIIAATVGVVF